MPPARVILYAATLAAIVFAARGVFLQTFSVEVAAAATLAYVALFLAGVFSLRLRMFTDAILRGPARARGVALTFDDGPDPGPTRRVLDLLDAAGAKGTFFVIGRKVEEHPELVREMVARGHGVGVHGYDHDRLFSLRGEKRVRADLTRAVELLERVTGERPTVFRPPVGHTNPVIARVADALDLTVVGWSVSARDGTGRADPRDVRRRVRRGLRDGAIVLLHDGAERRRHEPTILHTLPGILEDIAARQLTVVPLHVLVGDQIT